MLGQVYSAQGPLQVVSNLSQSNPKAIPKLSQSYLNVISKLSQCCLQLLSALIRWEAMAALHREPLQVVFKLSQSYLKVVSELSQDNQLGSGVMSGLLCLGTTTSGS